MEFVLQLDIEPICIRGTFGVAVGRLDAAEPSQFFRIKILIPVGLRSNVFGQDIDDILLAGQDLKFGEQELLIRKRPNSPGELLGFAIYPEREVDAFRLRQMRGEGFRAHVELLEDDLAQA